ncbi:hypothetical protein CR513_59172, partial [Mucuna pruriens]
MSSSSIYEMICKCFYEPNYIKEINGTMVVFIPKIEPRTNLCLSSLALINVVMLSRHGINSLKRFSILWQKKDEK